MGASRRLEFQLPRSVLPSYAVLALVLSVALWTFGLRRGAAEVSLWSAAYLLLGLLSWRAPRAAPLVAGGMAFLLGFARTYRGGYNLDLGLGLVAFAIGVLLLRGASRGEPRLHVDPAGICLLAVAAWSAVSLVFALVRVRSFRPAPGFEYHSYQFNALGFAADEALIRIVIGATASFLWFGLYEYARALRVAPRTLNLCVFVLLVAGTAVLLVQRYFAPAFLHPAGWPQTGRLNGTTSFCYALADAALALFLLLPAWGFARGLFGWLTVVSVGMLTYAALQSGSRTALFTMLLGAVLWACAGGLRLMRQHRRLAALVALAAAALLVALTVVGYRLTPADQATPLGRLKYGIEQQGLRGHLVSQRLAIYPLMLRVLREYPLSGVGAGLYLAESSKQQALLMPGAQFEDPFLLASFAPNQFLNTGVELGIPAMLALVAVFGYAATAPLHSPGRGAGDAVVALLALVAALQLGPSFYNSEALVFCWLVIGLAARGGIDPAPAQASVRPLTLGPRVGAGLLAGAVLAGVVGHALSRAALDVEHQWGRLRWRLGIGMLAAQAGGRWSRPEATFSLDTAAPSVVVRWHAGDPAAPQYRAEVSFFVDGVLAERSFARSGVVRESTLRLPAVPGYKRISVRVTPPFVPAAASLGSDTRRLGLFIHSVTPGR